MKILTLRLTEEEHAALEAVAASGASIVVDVRSQEATPATTKKELCLWTLRQLVKQAPQATATV